MRPHRLELIQLDDGPGLALDSFPLKEPGLAACARSSARPPTALGLIGVMRLGLGLDSIPLKELPPCWLVSRPLDSIFLNEAPPSWHSSLSRRLEFLASLSRLRRLVLVSRQSLFLALAPALGSRPSATASTLETAVTGRQPLSPSTSSLACRLGRGCAPPMFMLLSCVRRGCRLASKPPLKEAAFLKT